MSKQWAESSAGLKAEYQARAEEARKKYDQDLAAWEEDMVKKGKANLIRKKVQLSVDHEKKPRKKVQLAEHHEKPKKSAAANN